ncbi:hypothetical protein [Actinomadura sp. 21ATH]|uniref:hypothetical protein n=1 Tax=Actinomadura sp. 21ATH TaxID=1735444 RepID=UPI0035BFF1CE
MCGDSDAALRALLTVPPSARDIEGNGAGLDEAFIELIRDPSETRPDAGSRVGSQLRES